MKETHTGNLKKKAYETIKDKIIRCELVPGDPISEKEIIDEIGVSRTPIREALAKLEEENLIRIFPKRGIFVTDISIKDVIDIYSLRIVNESFAVRVAANHVDMERLGSYFEFWKNPNYHVSVEEHISQDRAFHSFLVESTGNKYLLQFILRLYDQANRIGYLSLERYAERLEQTRIEHIQIIKYLKEGKAADAEKAMRIHLENARDNALKLFPLSGVQSLNQGL